MGLNDPSVGLRSYLDLVRGQCRLKLLEVIELFQMKNTAKQRLSEYLSGGLRHTTAVPCASRWPSSGPHQRGILLVVGTTSFDRYRELIEANVKRAKQPDERAPG